MSRRERKETMRVLLVGLVGGMFNLLPVSGAAEEPGLSGEVLL